MLAALTACGGSGVSPSGNLEELPPTLSALGLQGPQAVPYTPQYPLWSNGSAKERVVILPAGESVDTSDRALWRYPDGTIFAKTFSYEVPGGGPPRKIETRIIRIRAGDLETVAYLWNAEQTEATLLPGEESTAVPVNDAQGNTFTHIVPSRVSCLSCHESGLQRILGFNELQLNHTLPGHARAQLARLADDGLLSGGLPADPARIEGDEETRAVIGYFQGNCAHCHDAVGFFDMTYPDFFANTVNVNSPRGRPLIVPGDPDSSSIYTDFVSGAMPPLGVQLPDTAMQERVRQWILNHSFP